MDFEADRIRFEGGYTIRGGHADTKSHRVRSAPLTDNLRLALRPYCFGRAEGELVFARHDDPSRPISGFGVYRRFIDAAQRAGLPRIRFHDLRHTFATRAMASGRVDIYALQRLLGHAQLTTTEIYLHFQPDPDLGRILSNPWPRDDDLYDG